MGSMNAMGWVLVASASSGVNEVWDLLVEFAERSDTEGPTVHYLDSDAPERYCVHPTSSPAVEFRGDELREVLLTAAVWKAKQMDENDLWRRD